MTKSASVKIFDPKNSILNNCKSEFAVIFLFFIVLLIFRYAFNTPDMDEIWNYQFARRILYEQIPYRDFYMLQAPFSAQVNALFLQLFSDKLIILRTVGVFVNSLNGLIIYFILRSIGKSISVSFIAAFTFLCLVFLYPQNNYSWYAILFLSISLLLELRKINYNVNPNRNNLFEIGIGVFLGLATITKQNIGVLGIIASFAFLLYYSALTTNKSYKEQCLSSKEKFSKVILKGIAFKSLGWISVVGIEIMYLLANSAFINFVDQTIVCAGIFLKYCSLPYSSLLNSEFVLLKIIAVLVPLAIITLFTLAVLGKQPYVQKTTTMLISLYSFVNFSMIFPIADPIHLILAMPLPVICLILLIKRMNKREDNVMTFRLITLIFITMICLVTVIIFMYKGYNSSVQNIKHYENIPLPNEVVESLKEVDAFIEQEEKSGKQIYFLNYRAAFYLIPLDKLNNKIDITFYGNMGSNGEKEMIDKLSSSSNIVVLIKGENMLPNRQETNVFDYYVRENMSYYTSVSGFDAFTK